MKTMTMMKFIISATLVGGLLFFSSCTSTKKIAYFNDLRDSVLNKELAEVEPVIMPKDILDITVSSLNPEASASFNKLLQPGKTTGGNPLGETEGYLVTREGTIQFPVLGEVKASGLTHKQLSDKIVKQLSEKKLLVEPTVSIRQTNFHVTVLGEVNRPAVIPVPNERINVLEAIGLAGDLTINAKRNNILVIREEGDKKIMKRINITSGSTLSSPYYYLQSNDVVYVEPNRAKINSSTQAIQLLPLILSTVSVLVLVLDKTL